MTWVPCDDPRVRLGVGRRYDGKPLLGGIRNPFDVERLIRVIRPDGAVLVELVLAPVAIEGRSVAMHGSVSDLPDDDDLNPSMWRSLVPIVGEVRVEVWQGDD